MALKNFAVFLLCALSLSDFIASAYEPNTFVWDAIVSTLDVTTWNCTDESVSISTNRFKIWLSLSTNHTAVEWMAFKNAVFRDAEFKSVSGIDIPVRSTGGSGRITELDKKVKEELLINVPKDEEEVPYNNPEQYINVPSRKSTYSVRIPDKEINIPAKTDLINVNIPEQVIDVPQKVKIIRLVTPAHTVKVPSKQTQFKLNVAAKKVLVPGKVHKIQVLMPGGRLIIPEEKNLIKLLREAQIYKYQGVLDVSSISEAKTMFQASLKRPKVEQIIEGGDRQISVVKLGPSDDIKTWKVVADTSKAVEDTFTGSGNRLKTVSQKRMVGGRSKWRTPSGKIWQLTSENTIVGVGRKCRSMRICGIKRSVRKSKSQFHPNANIGQVKAMLQRDRRENEGSEEEISTGMEGQNENGETVRAITRNVRSLPGIYEKLILPFTKCQVNCQCSSVCTFFNISEKGDCNSDNLCVCLVLSTYFK